MKLAATTLGDRLWAVHIHDNLGEKDLHSAPFTGTADYDAILRGLRGIHFPGYFTLEVAVLLSKEKVDDYVHITVHTKDLKR